MITAYINLSPLGKPATIKWYGQDAGAKRGWVFIEAGACSATIYIDDVAQGRALLDAVGAAVAHLEAIDGAEVAS